MKVEILGTGCYNCLKLEELVDGILLELGRSEIEVVRIDDEHYIRKYMPLDDIPGVLIDGVLVSTREFPQRATLVEWLSAIPSGE